MPQPYNYQIEDPLVGFTNTLGVIQTLNQQRAQQEEQRRQQERARAMQEAVQSASRDPSPENLAQIYLQFPEAKDQLDAYRGALGDADKNTLGSAAREAIILSQTGKTDQVASVFERYAQAADNSGRQDLAQQFRDAQRVAEQSPESAAFTARVFYNQIDPKGYEAVFSAQTEYDTPFLKELVAEGVQPGSPEWQQALRDKREGDPWIVVPGIGLYRKDDVAKLTEGQSAAPVIPEGAAKFLRQNPQLRDDFDRKYGKGSADRILGGASSNASGGF